MTFWVHVETDGRPWYQAKTFHPPLPDVITGKGYPYYYVEIDGFIFEFASIEEMDTCIDTLRQRNLPSTDQETEKRGTGPGLHWLNKLPGHVRLWRYREKAVKYLQKARDDFKLQIKDV
jgi:hypothetical protein